MSSSFNWAGAASGVQDQLQTALKMQLLEEESRQRQQQLDQQAENQRINRQIAQQNADSLSDERQSRIDAAKAKQDRQAQLMAGAKALLADPSLAPEDVREFEVARANHIIRYGEDLPDAAITSYYGQPKKRPSSLRTPEEMQQEKDLITHREREQARFAPPKQPTPSDIDRQQREDARVASQNYLAYLRQRHGNVDAALAEFDSGPGITSAMRKAGGFVDIDTLRKMLINLYRAPLTAKERMAQQLAAGGGAKVLTGEK